MERTNKGLVVTVIILTILVLSLGGYIVYDKMVMEKKDTSSEKENKNEKVDIEELEVDSSIINELMNKINYVQEDLYKKEEFSANKFTNEQILSLGFVSLLQDKKVGEVKTISEEELTRSIENILGNSIVYTHRTLDSLSIPGVGCYKLNYQVEKKQYSVENYGCDAGWRFDSYASKVVKAEKHIDKVVIEQKALYSVPDGENSPREFISVYKAKVNMEDVDKERENLIAEKIKDAEEWGNPYFDKADTYKYTFTKEGNDYVFTSVEILK